MLSHGFCVDRRICAYDVLLALSHVLKRTILRHPYWCQCLALTCRPLWRGPVRTCFEKMEAHLRLQNEKRFHNGAVEGFKVWPPSCTPFVSDLLKKVPYDTCSWGRPEGGQVADRPSYEGFWNYSLLLHMHEVLFLQCLATNLVGEPQNLPLAKLSMLQWCQGCQMQPPWLRGNLNAKTLHGKTLHAAMMPGMSNATAVVAG